MSEKNVPDFEASEDIIVWHATDGECPVCGTDIDWRESHDCPERPAGSPVNGRCPLCDQRLDTGYLAHLRRNCEARG